MRLSSALAMTLAAATLTGCAETVMPFAAPPASKAVSAEGHAQTPQAARLTEQARSLEQMTGDIVRKATMRGAGVGALAGCSLAVVSAQSAGRCVSGALVGGVIGGALGAKQGERDVAARVDLIRRDDLAQSLSRASARLGTVRAGIDDLIASQDRELAQMASDRDAGRMSAEAFEARRAEMGETREALAEVLMLSARQAAQARTSIEAAREAGQDGLDWHLKATRQIEVDATSARSEISLL